MKFSDAVDMDLLYKPKTGLNQRPPLDKRKIEWMHYRLGEILHQYGVSGELRGMNRGATLTSYHVKFHKNILIAQIEKVKKDIALQMNKSSIRIVPNPEKALITLEVERKDRETVYLRSLIHCKEFSHTDLPLLMPIGLKTDGNAIYRSLTSCPHLLVAGTTGSGKSSWLNSVILSWLYKYSPDELQLCMIDPKKSDLTVFRSLKDHHLIQCEDVPPVATNADDALKVLASLVNEMRQRQDLFDEGSYRDIRSYNSNSGRFLPYIVCIIDEFADLMINMKDELSDLVQSLAQLARSTGIHLILATQRPEVKIVSGAIKTNFPTRIAFKLFSGTDSKTILDRTGAESLLGHGDGLFLGSDGRTYRFQSPFVSEEETKNVVQFITRRMPERENHTYLSYKNN